MSATNRIWGAVDAIVPWPETSGRPAQGQPDQTPQEDDDTQPIPVQVPTQPSRPTRGQKVVISIAGVLAVIGIIFAVSGNSADHKFIQRLDDGGIAYSSEANAIAGGHSVCDSLDAGYSVDTVTTYLIAHTPFSAFDSGYIVGASVYAYCPKYTGQIL
jgi:hypothetical protein